jgi:hypothetical protein
LIPQRKGKLANLKRESTGAQDFGDECERRGEFLPAGEEGIGDWRLEIEDF